MDGAHKHNAKQTKPDKRFTIIISFMILFTSSTGKNNLW